MLKAIGFVALGGFFGAIARFWFSQKLNKSSNNIPLGTFTVNVVGSFLAGILFAMKVQSGWILLLSVGLLGSLTTFATLKVEMTYMLNQKRFFSLMLYILITYGLGLLLAFIGYFIGNALT